MKSARSLACGLSARTLSDDHEPAKSRARRPAEPGRSSLDRRGASKFRGGARGTARPTMNLSSSSSQGESKVYYETTDALEWIAERNACFRPGAIQHQFAGPFGQ